VSEDAVDPVRLGGHRKAGSYLQAQFHRLRARRGAKKAIDAVAASMLTAVYHMLKTGTFYQDLGADHNSERFRTAPKTRQPARGRLGVRQPDHRGLGSGGRLLG
jgi:hypothetical protein